MATWYIIFSINFLFVIQRNIALLPTRFRNCRKLKMATTDAELDELRRKVNSNIPFSIFELESSLQSFQNLEITEISYTSLQAFLRNFAHLSHKDFDTTRLASEKIREILPPVGSQQFQVLFQHVLQGGNWSRAYEKSLTFPTKSKPWAVLVTGK